MVTDWTERAAWRCSGSRREYTGGHSTVEDLLHLQSFNAEYVQRLMTGDSVTNEHFAEYFGELLLIKLRARLRSDELANEVRQETFLRVLTALKNGALQHPERLGAFVNAVCNNVLLEMYRSNARSAPLEAAGDPVCSGINSESALVSKERTEQIGQVLRNLSQKDRSLLVAVLEERDKDEICAEYGVKREYLRVLLHRAVERARKLSHVRSGAQR